MLRRRIAGLLRAQPRAQAAGVTRAGVKAASTDARGVLLVNHGYPPAYNAGSEVYTQLIARGLASRGMSAAVFSREEDLLRPDYKIRRDVEPDAGLPLFVVNMARSVTRFADDHVDAAFAELLKELRPGTHVAFLARKLLD